MRVDYDKAPVGATGYTMSPTGPTLVRKILHGRWEYDYSRAALPETKPIYETEAEAVNGRPARRPRRAFKNSLTRSEMTHKEDD